MIQVFGESALGIGHHPSTCPKQSEKPEWKGYSTIAVKSNRFSLTRGVSCSLIHGRQVIWKIVSTGNGMGESSTSESFILSLFGCIVGSRCFVYQDFQVGSLLVLVVDNHLLQFVEAKKAAIPSFLGEWQTPIDDPLWTVRLDSSILRVCCSGNWPPARYV